MRNSDSTPCQGRHIYPGGSCCACHVANQNVTSTPLFLNTGGFAMQGHKPVNFPGHPYDREDICKPACLADFVHRSREMASRLVKSQQTSRSHLHHTVPGRLCSAATVLHLSLVHLWSNAYCNSCAHYSCCTYECAPKRAQGLC